MSAPTAGTDRRAALKARHRQAIVDAAAQLMGEVGGTAFSVDELAERADVSRRTVFNHFASLDDVVTAVSGDVLGAIVDGIESRAASAADGGAPSLLDEVAIALRAEHLVPPMAYLHRVLGGDDPARATRQAMLVQRAFTDVGERISAAMLRRHPEVDELSAELLVAAVTGATLVLFRRWHLATGAVDDAASRRAWDDLVDRLIALLHTGHCSTGHCSTGHTGQSPASERP